MANLSESDSAAVPNGESAVLITVFGLPSDTGLLLTLRVLPLVSYPIAIEESTVEKIAPPTKPNHTSPENTEHDNGNVTHLLMLSNPILCESDCARRSPGAPLSSSYTTAATSWYAPPDPFRSMTRLVICPFSGIVYLHT